MVWSGQERRKHFRSIVEYHVRGRQEPQSAFLNGCGFESTTIIRMRRHEGNPSHEWKQHTSSLSEHTMAITGARLEADPGAQHTSRQPCSYKVADDFLLIRVRLSELSQARAFTAALRHWQALAPGAAAPQDVPRGHLHTDKTLEMLAACSDCTKSAEDCEYPSVTYSRSDTTKHRRSTRGTSAQVVHPMWRSTSCPHQESEAQQHISVRTRPVLDLQLTTMGYRGTKVFRDRCTFPIFPRPETTRPCLKLFAALHK